MAESISFSAVNATEEITFAATIDSEEIVFRYTDAARGPAGDGGGGGSVTSYVDDIESLPDYPTSFPTTPADINNVGTSKLLGRHGAGTGTAQEIGIDGGLELHGGNIRRAALTGFIEASAGSGTTTLSASAASEGGNGAADAGKLAKFDSQGVLSATDGDGNPIRLGGLSTSHIMFGGPEGARWYVSIGTNSEDIFLNWPSESGTFALVSQIPDISGKQDTITTETALSFYSLELGTALPITSGGTGGITAGAARSNLDAQQTLVSGTNIKTVNGNSLLGSGDVVISGATFDNPSAQVGLTAINGTASTAMRSDAAPAINQGITPSWTAAHTFTQSIAAASTATAIELINPTAATSGNQRWSPATVWTGQGWKTNATAASQSVALRAFALPIQGAASPSCEWTLQSSTAGGAWSTFFKIRNGDGGIYGFNQNAAENFRISGFSSDTYFDNSAFGNTLFRTNGSLRTNLTLYSSGSLHALFSGSIGISNSDTQISRRAAANISQGASDAAVAVAQTSSVQNVVAGTSNTAGSNRTYAGSQGTGTGVGGDHIFTVATAGTSGTSQNALVEAFRVRQDRACFIANVSAEPATPTGGGVFYVEAGALKYKGSSGTVTTIANA